MKRSFHLTELILICFVVLVLSCTIHGAASTALKKNPVPICADNMKRMVQAAHQYAADHNSTLPGTDNKVEVNWQMRLAPYLGYKDLKPGWNAKGYPIYQCPTDQTPPADWLPRNGHITKISYCANATLIDVDNTDVNVDKHKGGRKLDAVKHKNTIILFAEDHSASNSLRYGAAIKCFNPGYTYEYSRQNGTLENDDAKIGYHNYKNNYAMLDGSIRLLIWEGTLKPENLWTLK